MLKSSVVAMASFIHLALYCTSLALYFQVCSDETGRCAQAQQSASVALQRLAAFFYRVGHGLPSGQEARECIAVPYPQCRFSQEAKAYLSLTTGLLLALNTEISGPVADRVAM